MLPEGLAAAAAAAALFLRIHMGCVFKTFTRNMACTFVNSIRIWKKLFRNNSSLNEINLIS